MAYRLLLGSFLAAIAWAQPATTTVTDTLRLANGSTFCGGTITVSWPTFTSADGFRIQGGSLPVAVNPSTGVFSISLVPTNTTSTPNQGFYSISYDLRPTICAPATSTWKVPSSGPVGLSGVETVAIPPPPQIPVNSLASPSAPGTYCLQFVGGIVAWSGTCANINIVGTARQVKVVTASGTATLSLPADLLLTGQSANGTDMLSGSRFTDTSPTGNFENFKSLAGASLWQVDVGGTLQAGSVPWARVSGVLASNIVSLFSGCSGTLFLAADGACHSSGTGTVTSFSAGNLSPLFTTSVATATTTPALSFSLSNAAANAVFAGPTSGVPAAPTFRALVGADLPNPSAATLGGIESFASVAHQWINSISTSGVPSASQPAFSDVSGSAACAQLPALTGDTTTSAGSCATTTAKINGTSFAGTNGDIVTFGASNIPADSGKLMSNVVKRAIGAGFDGAGQALTSGATQTVYFTVPFACTITAWNITVDTGTATLDVWKIATGTAIPTSANSITAAALPAIASGTAVHSTTLTGWTTSVAANDIMAVNINTVASATKASLILECDQ